MNEREALAALDRRSNYEASGRLPPPTLERIRALVELLDHPERAAPAVHITGTNGKTTCAWAATEVLRAAGLAVGTYTSPHLHSVRERIAYDGRPITPDELAGTYEYLEPFLADVDERVGPLTWFEVVTAMAYAWFAEKAVDALVVEVGMGGGWDATNVLDGAVAVVTEVALDHPELGATTVEVMGEKAGIVKPGATVLTAEGDPAVLAVLEDVCRARGAALRRHGEAFGMERRSLAVGGQQLDLRLGDRTVAGLLVPAFGERIALDVAVGAAAATALLGDRPLEDGLYAEALSRLRLPGRVEVVRRRPLVVLDGAHNVAAARALAGAVRESFTWERLTLVLGMLGNKDVEGVVAALAPLASRAVVAPVASPRAADAGRIAAAAAGAGLDVQSARSVADALSVAIETSGGSDAVLVTGSLYTVAEAAAAVRAKEPA